VLGGKPASANAVPLTPKSAGLQGGRALAPDELIQFAPGCSGDREEQTIDACATIKQGHQKIMVAIHDQLQLHTAFRVYLHCRSERGHPN
jgi:hypothetical protein